MSRFLSVLALGLSALALVEGGPSAPVSARSELEAADVYTCPMHPEVTDTKPSRCPKCKMKLVAK